MINKNICENIDEVITTCKEQGYFPIPFNLSHEYKVACRIADGLNIIKQPDNKKSYRLAEIGAKILLENTTTFEYFTQEKQKEEISFMQLKYWFWIALTPVIVSGIISFIIVKLTS